MYMMGYAAGEISKSDTIASYLVTKAVQATLLATGRIDGRVPHTGIPLHILVGGLEHVCFPLYWE